VLSIDPDLNIVITRGDGEPVEFDIFDADGAALDVSAWSWALTVKKDYDDAIGSAKFQKTSGGGGITVIAGDTPGVLNRVRVQFDDNDTASLDSAHVYDLQGNDGTRSHTPTDSRRFFVRKDVTTPGAAGQPPPAIESFTDIVVRTRYYQDTATGLYWKETWVNGVETLAGPSVTVPF